MAPSQQCNRSQVKCAPAKAPDYEAAAAHFKDNVLVDDNIPKQFHQLSHASDKGKLDEFLRAEEERNKKDAGKAKGGGGGKDLGPASSAATPEEKAKKASEYFETIKGQVNETLHHLFYNDEGNLKSVAAQEKLFHAIENQEWTGRESNREIVKRLFSALDHRTAERLGEGKAYFQMVDKADALARAQEKAAAEKARAENVAITKSLNNARPSEARNQYIKEQEAREIAEGAIAQADNAVGSRPRYYDGYSQSAGGQTKFKELKLPPRTGGVSSQSGPEAEIPKAEPAVVRPAQTQAVSPRTTSSISTPSSGGTVNVLGGGSSRKSSNAGNTAIPATPRPGQGGKLNPASVRPKSAAAQRDLERAKDYFDMHVAHLPQEQQRLFLKEKGEPISLDNQKKLLKILDKRKVGPSDSLETIYKKTAEFIDYGTAVRLGYGAEYIAAQTAKELASSEPKPWVRQRPPTTPEARAKATSAKIIGGADARVKGKDFLTTAVKPNSSEL